MICVTGAERTYSELSQRLDRYAHLPLQEIRVDCQEQPEEAWNQLCEGVPKTQRARWIVTSRLDRAEAESVPSKESRLRLLEAALAAGVGWVDLEWEEGEASLARLVRVAGPGRVLVSHHLYHPRWEEAEIRKLLAAMAATPAHGVKLALAVEDVSQLREVRALGEFFFKNFDKPLVLVPMGGAGVVGRVLYPQLHSAWTYAAATAAVATAPGQLTVEELAAMGVPHDKGQSPPLLVLFGEDQVLRSLGPPVYNTLFRHHGLPHVYLPAPTKDLAAAKETLLPFGLVGAAVTMPHKDTAATLVDSLQGDGAKLQSINTLVYDRAAQRWEGLSTDGFGVVAALGAHLKDLGRRADKGRPITALVLGAGGAAWAAAFALDQAGVAVSFSARSPEKLRAKGRSIGFLPQNVHPWERRHEVAWDLLIHATPVGSRARGGGLGGELTEVPLDLNRSHRGHLVLDMITSPAETTLLKEARRLGLIGVSGVEMWTHQGLPQLQRWTGRVFTEDDLRPLIQREMEHRNKAGEELNHP